MNLKEQNILSSWLQWHFYEMPRVLFSVWKDYLWFGLNFFSIPILLSTLFAPWRRYQWRYPKGFNVGEFFSSLVSNIFSRFIGAWIRVFLVLFGIVVQMLIFFVGVSIIMLWMLIPLIVILLLFIFIS